MARRDLDRGDELTYDYATTETDPGWSMRCLCGSPVCRGVVTGLDHQQPWFWPTYAGHTHSYVAQRLTRST